LVILSREEAAKQLRPIWSQVIEKCKLFNREDSVIALLCLQDAFDNLLNKLGDLALTDLNWDSEMRTMVYRTLAQWMLQIERVLDLILNLGGSEPRKSVRQPTMTLSIGESPDDIAFAMIFRRQLGPSDATIPIVTRMAGRRKMALMLVVKESRGTFEEKFVGELVNLILLSFKYAIFDNTAHRGYSLTVSEDKLVPQVNYPRSMTPLKVMLTDRTDPRTMSAEGIWTPEWSSDFGKLLEPTLSTVGLGMASPTHRAAFEREQMAFFRGYESFPSYVEQFSQQFGYSMSDFQKVVVGLQRLARPRGFHMVYVDLREKALRDIVKSTGLSKHVVGNVLDSLTWKMNASARHLPLVPAQMRIIFSFRQIMAVISRRLQGFFDSIYDDVNVKGEFFECASRRELSSHGFSVHNGRLEIFEQVLTDRDSNELWGHTKKRTDFDVLGSKGGFLIIVESKERKRKIETGRGLRNIFTKYYREHFLKCKWLSTHLNYLNGSPCLEAMPSTGRKFILPLIVCNRLIQDLDPAVPLLAFKEFSYFSERFDSDTIPDAEGLVEIPTAPDRSIRARILPLDWPKLANFAQIVS